MLKDVAGARSVTHPIDEATMTPQRTPVIFEGWDEINRSIRSGIAFVGRLSRSPILTRTRTDGTDAQMLVPRYTLISTIVITVTSHSFSAEALAQFRYL